MSATVPMNLQDIMDEIYVAVDNDPTNSTTMDDEWTSRLRLINMGIKAWEGEDVLWNELWTPYVATSAINASTTYPIDAGDFRFPGSQMKFAANGSALYADIVRPDEAFKYQQAGAQATFITGNPSDTWAINLTRNPVVGDGYFGSIMSFYYYKSATRLALPTSVPEMSDPSYLVNFVSYRKNLYNGRSNVAQDYLSAMQTNMDNMKIRNIMRVPYGSSQLEDMDLIRNGTVLGL